MNRRQFLKWMGAAVVAVPVVLVRTKKQLNIGIDCSATTKWTTIDCSPLFNTQITKLKNIADERLIIFTEDEIWELKGDPNNGSVLTKIGIHI